MVAVTPCVEHTESFGGNISYVDFISNDQPRYKKPRGLTHIPEPVERHYAIEASIARDDAGAARGAGVAGSGQLRSV
jgi:hypothetical protein